MIPELQGFDSYIIAVSGGRDSTAMWLWARENLPHDELIPVHNPTGAAWPDSIEYLSYLEDTLGKIAYVRANHRPLPPRRDGKPRAPFTTATSLYGMILLRGKWPSFWQRYCTCYLKEWPIRLYAKEVKNSVILLGERRSESKRRANLPTSGDLFAGKRAYRHSVYRPILDWSDDDVDAMLSRHSIPSNPIYAYTDRCGCWCCPLARKSQVVTFCKMYPDLARRWADLETEINHTWKPSCSITGILKEVIPL